MTGPFDPSALRGLRLPNRMVLSPMSGNTTVATGHADLVPFGIPYGANPDLAGCCRTDLPLNEPDPSTFYGEGPGRGTGSLSLPA